MTYNDVIGFLYDDIKPIKIVRSNGIILGGHNPYFWQISKRGHFLTAPKTSSVAYKKSKKYQGWLDTLSIEDSKLLFDAWLKVFGKNDTIYDLGKNFGKDLRSNKDVLEAYEPHERKRIKDSVRNLIKFLLIPVAFINKDKKRQNKRDMIDKK